VAQDSFSAQSSFILRPPFLIVEKSSGRFDSPSIYNHTQAVSANGLGTQRILKGNIFDFFVFCHFKS
jgi:hypothetical protein